MMFTVKWPYTDCTVFQKGDTVRYIRLRGKLLFWHPKKKAWLKSIRQDIVKDAGPTIHMAKGECLSAYLEIVNDLVPNFAMAVGHRDGEIGLKVGHKEMIFGGVWIKACRDHIEMESWRNAVRLGMKVTVNDDVVTIDGKWGKANSNTIWGAFFDIIADNYLSIQEELECMKT